MATPQAAAQPTSQPGPTPTPGQVINSEPFDVFSQDMNFPNLPGQAKHQPGKAAAFQSRVPDVDAGMLSTLAPAQRSRLQSERDSAAAMDQQLQQVQCILWSRICQVVPVMLSLCCCVSCARLTRSGTLPVYANQQSHLFELIHSTSHTTQE